MTAQSNTPPAPSERLHALDALRAIALMLGLIVHGSLAFLPGSGAFWFTHDAAPSAALSAAFYVPHMFRMLLFFLIAGFFGRLLVERLGVRAFARDRLRRITLVLVVFWPIILAAIVAAAIFAASYGDPSPPAPPSPSFTPGDFPLTHLWFLYVLTLCYAAALACRHTLRWFDRRGLVPTVADRAVRFLTGRLGPMVLAVPLAAALSVQQGWLPWFGIPTPDRSLYPNLPASIAFGSSFAFGWCLQRQPARLHYWAGQWPFHLAIAAAATIACLAMWGVAPSLAAATPGLHVFVYALLYGWGGWSWTAGLIGLAMRYLSAPRPAIRYLADASYWVYLVHLPVVIALQAFAVHLSLPAPAKFAIVLCCALATTLLSYHLLVRRSWIGKWLNGRRRPQVKGTILGAGFR